MSTILVVDDELGIRALLSEILADEGHTVELAENAAQARALRGHVAARRTAVGDEPLRQRGIEAAGDRILGHAGMADEATHLELRVTAGGVRPDDPDLGQRGQGAVIGLQRQHGLGAVEQQ